MTHRHHREDALDRFQYLDLYQGALQLEDDYKRLVACYIILLAGRVGMRIGEIMHLHEGWIDWRIGVISIPRYDPCGCYYCWRRAKPKAKKAGVDWETALYERQWEPKTKMGSRPLPFNWSQRITAILLAFFDQYEVLDENYRWTLRLLRDVADNSQTIHRKDISWHALRATAETFWADQLLDKKARRDLGGWETDKQAWAYSAQSSGILSNKLREAVGKDPFVGLEQDFVALTEMPFAREPADPRDIYPAARVDPFDRGPVFNPRTPNPPKDIEYERNRHQTLVNKRGRPLSAEDRRELLREVMAPHIEAAQEDAKDDEDTLKDEQLWANNAYPDLADLREDQSALNEFSD